MRRVIIQNPSVNKTYKSYVDADYSSGTSLTVKNNNSFAANDLVVIGEPTEELTEEKKVNAISGTTILTLASALSFAHAKGTSVYKVPWDFVSIESRSTSSGTFALLSLSPIQWDSKTNQTIYYDSGATATYQYRFRYYNSVTNTYSEYSPTASASLPSRQTVQYLIDNVRKIAGDQEKKIVSDDEIIREFNRAQDLIYAHNPKYWFLYADTYELGSGSIAATNGNKVYSFANLSNFGELAGIKYQYNSGAINEIYRLRKIDEVEFDGMDSDQNITPQDWPTSFKLLPADPSSANGYFKVTPRILSTGIGTFYPLYYQKMLDLSTVSDVTPVPLPFLLENLAIAYIFRIKGNEAKAGIFESYMIEQSISVRGRAVIIEPKGLKMLDQMDQVRKRAVGQPRSVWKFRGQKAISRLYGNRLNTLRSDDYEKENFF